MDIEDLRDQIIDYYGTAAMSGNIMAYEYVEYYRFASDEEIVQHGIYLGIIECEDDINYYRGL